MDTETKNTDTGATQDLYKSVKGFAVDKAVSLLAGLAGVILGGIVFPLATIVFTLYPLDTYLQDYPEFCTSILVTTAVIWGITLRKKPAFAWGLYMILSTIVLVIAGMMRLEMVLTRNVEIQFLLYFAGIVMVCEMLLTAFTQMILKAIEVLRGK